MPKMTSSQGKKEQGTAACTWTHDGTDAGSAGSRRHFSVARRTNLSLGAPPSGKRLTSLSGRLAHVAAGAVLGALLAGGTAYADVTAAYDGSFSLPRRRGTAEIAGALNQIGSGVSGTLAMASGDPMASGMFWVTGQVRGSKVALTGGNEGGAILKWKGLLDGGGGMRGRAKLRGGGKRMKGLLALSRRVVEPPTTPPHTCDSSYFTGQVMGRVLQPVCANCHVQNARRAIRSPRRRAWRSTSTARTRQRRVCS
jgi:hypothetical protein